MSEASKKARRPPGYKPFWEGGDESEAPVEPTKPSYDWSNLKKRILGDKSAAELATEETEELKKKKNGI